MSPHPTPPDPGEREALRAEVHPDRTAVDAPDGVEVRLRVPCARYGDRVMSIDVFTPSVAPAAPRPAIVFVHGGAWVKGSPSQFHHQAGYLAARHGFLAVSAEYRFADEAPFPTALQDIKCAMRWVRAHAREYNVDPGRVAVAGGSSGAHLASLVLTTADVPEYEGAGGYEGFDSAANAGVLFNGEFDLPTLIEMGSLAGCLQRFLGGSLKDVPERYAKASSARRIHAGVPPTLLMHGGADKGVPATQSTDFQRKLLEAGVRGEVEVYEGKPHGWFNKEPDRTVTLERMERFLADVFVLNAAT